LKRTDNTLEDRHYIEEERQYIRGQTIHWSTDNALEDRQYIEGQTIHSSMYCLSFKVLSVLYNVLSVLQCIVCPSMYCLSFNVLSVLYNVLSVLRTDNTLEDRKYIEGKTIHCRRQTIH
jgi:hypothetical protein